MVSYLFVLYLTFCANDHCVTLAYAAPEPRLMCEQRMARMANDYEIKEAECRQIETSV